MKNFNRFDFEQEILNIWQITDQLDTITEGVLEYGWTNDQVANALIGLKEIYNLKFDKLFAQFEDGVRQRAITSTGTLVQDT